MSTLGHLGVTRLRAFVVVVLASGMAVVGQGPASADEGSWAATGALNQPRVAHTVTLLINGRVLVAGGRSATAPLSSSELYDPITERFTPTGSMNEPRWSHTATLLPNGKVLVAGGFGGTFGPGNAQPVLTSAELYDPAAGTWTSTPPMQTRRALHSAALLGNGKVLVAGGRTCTAPPPAACDFNFRTNTAELYDPATNTWSPTGDMLDPSHTTSAVVLENGKVLIPAGFSDPDPHNSDNTAEVYDPATGTWSLAGNLNSRRARQGAMALHDGRVLTGPGSQNFVFGPPVVAIVNTRGEVYDPATNAWTLTDPAVEPGRYNFWFTTLPNGKALVAGGNTRAGVPTTSSEVYDPATNTWASAGTMTRVHGATSALANSRQAVVLSADPFSFVFDPRVCGTNCGKVLVVGDNLTDGTADLYTPASVLLENCTSTVSKRVDGDVNVAAGEVTCITNAQISGSVIVAPGGAVVINYSHIRGSLLIDGAAGVRMCGSNVGGSTSITHSFGPVLIGGAATASGPRCAPNQFSGPVTLDANQFVGLASNQFRDNLSVTWSAGLDPSASVQGNQVRGSLSCANNTPMPTNGGRRNQVSGSRSGQCAAGGF